MKFMEDNTGIILIIFYYYFIIIIQHEVKVVSKVLLL